MQGNTYDSAQTVLMTAHGLTSKQFTCRGLDSAEISSAGHFLIR